MVGGGPAGMMLGYLLARCGVEVYVLEKHEDFFRDFRGDTIHPSTMDVLHELGLLDEFLALPHQEVTKAQISFKGGLVTVGDFSSLPTKEKFIAFTPQWEFLNFLAAAGSALPSFHLMMSTEATSLIEEEGRVLGVIARSASGEVRILSDLVVAADGRDSRMRRLAGLQVEDFGAPIDVLWMKIPKPKGATPAPLAFFGSNRFLVLIDREDYYQSAFLIRKGGFPEVQVEGLEAFRERICSLAPFLKESVMELDSWDKVKLLSVQIDRLRKWFKGGLLCIGDSAHAMSPAGGIGINLAIQDAVATANLLGPKLKNGALKDSDLQAVQDRRERPTKQFQSMQVFLHRFIISTRNSAFAVAVFRFVLKHFAFARRRIAYTMGVGFLPEHVSPEISGL